VLSALALSAVRGLARPGLVGALVFCLAAAVTVWWVMGRPRPVSIRTRLTWLGGCLRRPHLGLLAIVLAGGYTYLVALGLFTPQNDSDPLVYQLARAAVWRQQEGIGLVGAPMEPRLDVNPIVAEVGQAVSLVLAGSERFVWLVQLSAVAALALGAFALARRAGIPARNALFGSMLVPALPVIATQAITGYNDLVAASFIVAATVFVLGRERRELVPFALALALAVGTKFTTPFAVPVVALIGALGQPVRRWPRYCAAGAAGALLGSGWYVVNLVRTGALDGGLASFANQEPIHSAGAVLYTSQLFVLDSIERPGTAGAGADALIAIGVGVTAVGIYAWARGRRGATLIAAGLGLVAMPVVVDILSWSVGALFTAFWHSVGNRPAGDFDRVGGAPTIADGAASWFGPLAALVGATMVVIAGLGVRRRTTSAVALGLALAPWIGISILALAVTYDPWRGRFLVAVWVMSLAAWGLLERWAVIAECVAAVTAVTFVLCLAQYLGKPSGIDAVAATRGPGIWSFERWQAQTYLRGSGRRNGETLVVRQVERGVPDSASIDVSVGTDDVNFPYFGPRLTRRVRLLGPGEDVASSAEWLVAAPEMSPHACTNAWRAVVEHPTGWRLYRRVSPDLCRHRRPLRPRIRPQSAS